MCTLEMLWGLEDLRTHSFLGPGGRLAGASCSFVS